MAEPFSDFFRKLVLEILANPMRKLRGHVLYLDYQKLICCEAITLFPKYNYHLVSNFVDKRPFFLDIVYNAIKSSLNKQQERHFQQDLVINSSKTICHQIDKTDLIILMLNS